MLEDSLIGRELKFCSSRGDSVFRFDGRELAMEKWRRRRETSDREYLTTECADLYDSDLSWNIECEDPPESTCAWGTQRWGDCWRSDNGAGDHTHQTEESEDHCAGLEQLGMDVACATPCACDWCYYQNEYCAVNANHDSSYWNDIGNDEDDERLVNVLFDRSNSGYGWGAFSFQPGGSFDRTMTLHYNDQDWDYCDIGEIIHQWKWDLEGDHFNPEFLTPPELQEDLSLLGQVLSGYSDVPPGFIDENACCYIWFEYKDVGPPGGPLGSNGSMYIDNPPMWGTTGVAVGIADPNQPGTIAWLFGDGIVNSWTGYKDLSPFVGTTDPDSLPHEQFIWCHELYPILEEAVEQGYYTPGDADVSLFFLIVDSAGNWKKQRLDLHQEYHITDPAFAEWEGVSQQWDVHVYEQEIVDNPGSMVVISGVEKTGGNFFYPPKYDIATVKNFQIEKNKEPNPDTTLETDLSLTRTHIGNRTKYLSDHLTLLMAKAIDLESKYSDTSCEVTKYVGFFDYNDLNATGGTHLYVSDTYDTKLAEANRLQYLTVAGGPDVSYFDWVKDIDLQLWTRKGSGEFVYQNGSKQNSVKSSITGTPSDKPTFPSTKGLIKAGGIERVSVYRASESVLQEKNLVGKSESDMVISASHGWICDGIPNYYTQNVVVGRPGVSRFIPDEYAGESGNQILWCDEVGGSWLQDDVNCWVCIACEQLDKRLPNGSDHPAFGRSAAKSWDDTLFVTGDTTFIAFCGFQFGIASNTTGQTGYGKKVYERFQPYIDQESVQVHTDKYWDPAVYPDNQFVIAWMEAARDEALCHLGPIQTDPVHLHENIFSSPVAHDRDWRWEVVHDNYRYQFWGSYRMSKKKDYKIKRFTKPAQ